MTVFEINLAQYQYLHPSSPSGLVESKDTRDNTDLARTYMYLSISTILAKERLWLFGINIIVLLAWIKRTERPERTNQRPLLVISNSKLYQIPYGLSATYKVYSKLSQWLTEID